METLIRKGAEADIYKVRWHGRIAIKKIRKPKPYRQPRLDEELRKRRTVHEATLINAAKLAGVESPLIYFLDLDDKSIYMEHFEGPRIKDVLDEEELDSPEVFENVGKSIGLLHQENIIHGDLTTSNFILMDRRNVGLIDFGLSFRSTRLEDKAVDLHLVKQTLDSAHSPLAQSVFTALLEGYQQMSGTSTMRSIKPILNKVEKRGRYARIV